MHEPTVALPASVYQEGVLNRKLTEQHQSQKREIARPRVVSIRNPSSMYHSYPNGRQSVDMKSQNSHKNNDIDAFKLAPQSYGFFGLLLISLSYILVALTFPFSKFQ
jgi:hypothetical protein